jgi:hypothetical protein
LSGIESGFQSLLLSFGEFSTASIVMEAKEDGFYYDVQGIQHRIVPCMDDLNHLVMYHEFATITEDPKCIVEEAEIVHLRTIFEVFGTSISSTRAMDLQVLLEFIQHISGIQNALLS